MPKELKRKKLSDEKKGSILALLGEGYSEHEVQVQQTLGTTKLQTGRGQKRLSADQDDCQLIPMSQT